MLQRTDFTQYDIMPEDMINYLRYHGPHFTKKLVEFAAKHMKKDGKSIKSYTKEEVNTMLESYGIKLKNNALYDAVYVANMCLADFLGKSIQDEQHMALYIKDVIDDEDAYDGIVFNRWYADMCKKGVSIDWEEML